MNNKPTIIPARNSLAPLPQGFALEVDMPNNAAPLGVDPFSADFRWDDILVDNYWSMEGVQKRYDETGEWPTFTPKMVAVQPVFDPQEEESKRDMTPKLVLYFVENAPGLVFNKSRCQLASDLTGTSNPGLWASRLGRIQLRAGVLNKKAQIIFAQVSPAHNDDDVTF